MVFDFISKIALTRLTVFLYKDISCILQALLFEYFNRTSTFHDLIFTKHVSQGSDILSIAMPFVMGLGALIVPTVLMLVLALALFRYVLHARLSSSVGTGEIRDHLRSRGSLASAHSASCALTLLANNSKL